jgi:hypothetical protein
MSSFPSESKSPTATEVGSLPAKKSNLAGEKSGQIWEHR